MPADVQQYMVYWPAAAAVGAFLFVIFTLVWVLTRMPKIKAARETITKSRQQLNEARVGARESKKKVKVRRTEMKAMHKSAGKLFWQTEKTWVE